VFFFSHHWDRDYAVITLAFVSGCVDPTLILGTGSAGSTGVILSESSSDDEGTSSSEGTADSGPGPQPCGGPEGTGTCNNKIDLLFVIDNSGTMGEEQLTLATNFPLLIEQLESLEDERGKPVGVDVNIMVTTSDFDNPLCHGPWTKPDYVAAKGAPIYTPCTERLNRFTGYGEDPLVIEEACLDVCDLNAPAAPIDQFIHFAAGEDNVVGGSASDALACLAILFNNIVAHH